MTHVQTLEALGWTPGRSSEFEPYAATGLAPGRVGIQYRGGYVLFTDSGELRADASGKLRREGLPAVGDWVAYELLPEGKGLVHAILPRSSKFSRAQRDLARRTVQAAGEQVIAANVDVVLVVSALVGHLSLRRLERYLMAAWEGGAEPVVVLTKLDLCDDAPGLVAEVESVAAGVPVIPVSSVTGDGVDTVRGLLESGRTAALVGSSGVGKSTLVNRLLGYEAQLVREIRADGRGRHTTTARRLFPVPGGGLLLDTPGLRVIEPWDGEGLEAAFGEVEDLAAACRFSDCRHESEPGCAVREALADGRLDAGRYESYRRLERETAFLARKGDKAAESAERKRWKAVTREYREQQRLGW
ncbi:MAG: ribosome small subunit-dependent GTPase A [Gaiellales bacterium]